METVSTDVKTPTGIYVAELARRHGVVPVRTSHDALAEVIARLSDDDIATDETEDLIVMLKRAGVIDGATLVDLLGRHLDERRHV
jgi:hypothetical protein